VLIVDYGVKFNNSGFKIQQIAVLDSADYGVRLG
jgi:hypothetical protein